MVASSPPRKFDRPIQRLVQIPDIQMQFCRSGHQLIDDSFVHAQFVDRRDIVIQRKIVRLAQEPSIRGISANVLVHAYAVSSFVTLRALNRDVRAAIFIRADKFQRKQSKAWPVELYVDLSGPADNADPARNYSGLAGCNLRRRIRSEWFRKMYSALLINYINHRRLGIPHLESSIRENCHPICSKTELPGALELAVRIKQGNPVQQRVGDKKASVIVNVKAVRANRSFVFSSFGNCKIGKSRCRRVRSRFHIVQRNANNARDGDDAQLTGLRNSNDLASCQHCRYNKGEE